MGNFHSNARGGFRGSRGGGRDGGFRGRRDDSFNRDRGSGRGRNEMHDVTCAKCGKRCQVPFKPNGSKPIFCDDCFNIDGSNSRNQPQSQDSEQLRQINKKLDKILLVLQSLELEIDEDLEEDDSGEDEDFDEDDEDSDDDEELVVEVEKDL